MNHKTVLTSFYLNITMYLSERGVQKKSYSNRNVIYHLRQSMKKLLIVDDNKDIRELVIATLDPSEYKIFEAADAMSAIAIATEEKPDFIIMDVMLQGNMNGIEATKTIKNNPLTRHCNVIMLTGTDEKWAQEQALEAGAACYFLKPFSPLDLLKRVEDLALNGEDGR
jgi:two-component system, OmpR family, phosphate regulon response regulator PhoB